MFLDTINVMYCLLFDPPQVLEYSLRYGGSGDHFSLWTYQFHYQVNLVAAPQEKRPIEPVKEQSKGKETVFLIYLFKKCWSMHF